MLEHLAFKIPVQVEIVISLSPNFVLLWLVLIYS